MREPAKPLTDEEIIGRMRELGAQWFKNSDLLSLEELFRRFEAYKASAIEFYNRGK